jgi:DNA-binding NarL/FixJ family response regulator
VRLMLADDSVLFREGLASVLSGAGFDIVAQVGDADELLARICADPPDVAVVDVRMPPTHTTEGLLAAATIRREHPQTGVLVLSQYVETHYALSLISDAPQGAGYLLKDRVNDVAELLDAIRRIAAGGLVIDPSVVAQRVGRRRIRNPLESLSDRERAVLTCMAQGRSNSAIAGVLFLSEKTVEAHIRSIFTRLDLPVTGEDNRRVLAVLRYLSAER